MTQRAWLSLCLAAAIAVGTVPQALAADAADTPPAWTSLTAQQQAALGPLQRDWARIAVQQKQKWLEVAGRFPKMSAADRERVQQRMAAWARMTPAERGRARLQFQESRQLSPEDRQARWEAYQALPDAQRRALAQQARPATRAAPATAADSAEPGQKRNIVAPGRQAAPRPVAPTVVQAGPGATTTLMSTKPDGPDHQQHGMPKIVASEGFVERNTLLPQRGAQGAAVSRAASAPAPRR